MIPVTSFHSFFYSCLASFRGQCYNHVDIISQLICSKNQLKIFEWVKFSLRTYNFGTLIFRKELTSVIVQLVLGKLPPGRMPPALTLTLTLTQNQGGICWGQSSGGKFSDHLQLTPIFMALFLKKLGTCFYKHIEIPDQAEICLQRHRLQALNVVVICLRRNKRQKQPFANVLQNRYS